MSENSNLELIEDWTRIAQLRPEMGRVNVRFMVTEKPTVRQVMVKSTGKYHEVTDVIVLDETASIRLTLWDEDIDAVRCGNTYSMSEGSVRVYDECMFLTRGRQGLITESAHCPPRTMPSIDMSRPFAWRPKKKRKQHVSTGRSFQGESGREAKGYCSRKSF